MRRRKRRSGEPNGWPARQRTVIGTNKRSRLAGQSVVPLIVITLCLLPHRPLVVATSATTSGPLQQKAASRFVVLEQLANRSANHFDEEHYRDEQAIGRMQQLELLKTLGAPRRMQLGAPATNNQSRASQQVAANGGHHHDEEQQVGARPPATISSNHSIEPHHPDDLLAIESGGSDVQILHIGKQVAPYAVNLITPTGADKSSGNQTGGGSQPPRSKPLEQRPAQLLKLYRAGPPTPVFIQQPLPKAAPFERPPSVLPMFAAPNHLPGPHRQTAEAPFALLPSWPSVYVAQRHPNQAESAQQPPHQAPNGSPDQLGQLEQRNASSAPPRSNQTLFSGVEYEAGEPEATDETLGLAKKSKAEVEWEIQSNSNSPETNHSSTDHWAKLLRHAAEGNVTESLMVTNRSHVSLLCDADEMLVRFKFKRPFWGIIATNLDLTRSCRLLGNGSRYQELRIPLNSCGTRREAPRLFINNIHIQFKLADNDPGELKTIICSYPMKPRAPLPADLPTSDSGNLSERIVEIPSNGTDILDLQPARLIHYEPLLLISGLFLLALALVALVSTGYLLSRRRRRSSGRRPLNSTSRSSLASLTSGSSRIYRRPPAQSANQRPVVAPPLIRVEPTKGTKTRRPIGRKYADATSGPESKRRGHIADNTILSYKGHLDGERKRPPSERKQAERSSVDSLRNDNSSSVTTIEIPFTGSKLSETVQTTPAEWKEDPHNIETVTTRRRVEKQLFDERTTAKTLPASKRPTGERSSRRLATSDKWVGQKREPPPFGSIRSKLTSPSEFKRLQSISRLFEERYEATPSGRLELIPSRYKSRILSTMESAERCQLSHMLATDDVFRSMVVESTDRETFLRKIREDPKYANKFKQQTWALLEEILLDSNISSATSEQSETATSSSRLEGEQVIGEEAEPKRPKWIQTDLDSPIDRPDAGDEANNLHPTKTLGTLNEQRDSLEDDIDRPSYESAKSKTRRERPREEELKQRSLTPIIRVSQFNSTRTTSDGSTLINIDSITNISSPTSSSTTCTKRSFEQTTRYLEEVLDESLPYMDEKVIGYEYAKEAIHQNSSPSSLASSLT